MFRDTVLATPQLGLWHFIYFDSFSHLGLRSFPLKNGVTSGIESFSVASDERSLFHLIALQSRHIPVNRPKKQRYVT